LAVAVSSNLGGIIGGVRGSLRAPEGDLELATYRGVAWGGCLALIGGLALTLLLLSVMWSHWLAASP
jgi:hypothetical protein